MAKHLVTPVQLDPFESSVTKEHLTTHLTGRINGHDDNGKRLTMALFSKAWASGNLTPDGQLQAFQLPPRDSDAAGTPPHPKTLADVPYQFVRIAMSANGAVWPEKNTRMARRCGRLADFFDKDATAPAWDHPSHPASFHENFPYSVDNFECDSLLTALEDDNNLLDERCKTRWVLWMGLATEPEPEPSTTAGTDTDTNTNTADTTDTADDTAPIVHFLSRKRIFRVQNLLDQLLEVHTLLKQPQPGPESAKPVAVIFIVAVSYARSYPTWCAPPLSIAYDPRVPRNEAGNTVVKSGLHSTMNGYMQRLYARLEAHGIRPFEDPTDSGDYMTDSDDESIGSSIPPYDGPDPNVGAHGSVKRGKRGKRNTDWVVLDDDDPILKKQLEKEDEALRRKEAEKLEAMTDEQKEDYLKQKERVSELWKKTASLWSDSSSCWSSEEFSSDDGYDSDAPASKSQSKDQGKQPETSLESLSSSRPTTPPPARSIFETLDTNAAKGDAIEGDLHALLPEASSPSEDEWRACCSLLCLDPDAHRDARALSVKVPGTDSMWIKPSQLWTAYWMLVSRTERGLCGGVLADVMGTGKTYVCLVVCLLRAYIGYNRAEVEREWQLREHEAKKGAGNGTTVPKQHLPHDAGDGSTSIPCPCGNALGIECYANPGGITRRLAAGLSRGASLILAPQTVLDNWVKTVKRVRLQPKFYEPVVFHGKMAKEDTVLAPAPRLRQKLAMDVRPLPSVSKDGLFPQTWQPNVLEAVHDFKPSVAKDTYPERFILLATHMPERLTDFFQVPVPLRRKAGAGARERKTTYACPIGIQIVDEFHKAKEDAVVLARQHKHMRSSGTAGDDFDFWAITGTPLPAKLTDLETVTSLVQRLPEWDDPSSRHYAGRVEALRELQVAYEKAVATDGTPVQTAEFRSRAERFFQCGLIKRHTETSTFFGQRIFNLQDVPVKIIANTMPAAFRKDVGKVITRVGAELRKCMAGANPATKGQPNWDQAVRSSALFNLMMNLEIVATFPGAARLMLTEPPAINFSLAALRSEICQAKNRDVTEVALFQKHLDTVVEDSPHLKTILATLDEMARDKQKRQLPALVDGDPSSSKSALPPRKKPDARLKKLVVLCPRMGEAVFVYLALRKLRPDAHAVFLHFDLKMSERAALLRDFNRLDAGPGSQTPCVLVGTFRDAGTGNDLTVANYQILTGPLRLRSQQDQAFGRTNREGQTLRLHHRLLLTEDSPVDRIVMATQARRRIVSDPFSMDEVLELEEAEV